MYTGVQAQNRVLSGKVTGADDSQPIIGVNVLLKGTTTGAVTDVDGNYSLSVPTSGGTLVFSFIGYVTQEVAIDARSVVNVQLASDVKTLSEVVVTAIGLKQDKDKFASSVASVQGTNVARSGETGLLQGMSGKAAGVQITRNGGDPGAGAYILIRGQNTINGNAQPLFIVDGVPISNSSYNLGGGGNSIVNQSRSNDINPDDIADMQVLKGASAAALWGTRAANGVIMITTKKGKDSNGKVNVSFKSTVSIDKVNKMHQLQRNYGQGLDGYYDGYGSGRKFSWGDRIDDRQGGADVFITDPADPLYRGFVTFPDGTKRYGIAAGSGPTIDGRGAAAHGGKRSTNTYDHTADGFQTGHFIDNNLQVSGGNAKTNYMISYSNLNQVGIYQSFSDYKRNSARVNVSSQVANWMRVSANMNYINSYSTRINQGDNTDGLMLGMMRTPADYDNSQYTGTYTTVDGVELPDRHVSYRNPLGAGSSPFYSNPVWNINNNKNTSDLDRVIGNLEASIDPTSWLSFTARVGIDQFLDKNNEKMPLFSATYPSGFFQKNIITEKQTNADVFGRASKSFGQNFSGTLIVGLNYNDRLNELIHTQITDFILPSSPDLLTNALNSNLQASNGKTHIRTYAYYAQADLSAYDQLFVTLTGRQESASTYSKSFFFPSAALAWQFTKLGAFSSQSLLNFGKLRLSYGQVGIQPQPYLNVSVFGPSYYYDGYATGLYGLSAVYGGGFTRGGLGGNPNLTPETKTETEIGTDLRFLNNRLTTSITYYNNATKDLLLALDVPTSTGYSQRWLNAGSMENKGLEVELDYVLMDRGDFRWSISGNWSRNRNKVTSLAGSAAQGLSGGYGGQSVIEGQPFGVMYGTDFQSDANGKYLLDDNGFPQEGTANQVIGNPNPKWRAGLGTTMHYKKWMLYVLFDRVSGNQFYNGTRGALYNFGAHADQGNEVTSAVDLKTLDGETIPAGTPFRGQIKDFGGGPVALTQVWYQSLGTSFGTASVKQFIEDATATRLREVTLSYSLSSDAFRAATKLTAVDFSLTGRNLLLWTPFTGVDPEVNITGAAIARGSDWFTNPNTKSVLFTVKITL